MLRVHGSDFQILADAQPYASNDRCVVYIIDFGDGQLFRLGCMDDGGYITPFPKRVLDLTEDDYRDFVEGNNMVSIKDLKLDWTGARPLIDACGGISNRKVDRCFIVGVVADGKFFRGLEDGDQHAPIFEAIERPVKDVDGFYLTYAD
jgi:hypothetical protein